MLAGLAPSPVPGGTRAAPGKVELATLVLHVDIKISAQEEPYIELCSSGTAPHRLYPEVLGAPRPGHHLAGLAFPHRLYPEVLGWHPDPAWWIKRNQIKNSPILPPMALMPFLAHLDNYFWYGFGSRSDTLAGLILPASPCQT